MNRLGANIILLFHICSNLKDGKADVILRYSPDEARSLKAYGELPENGKLLHKIIATLSNENTGVLGVTDDNQNLQDICFSFDEC